MPAKNTDDINKDTETKSETDPIETEVEATEAPTERAPGHHIMVDGQSLGCYPTNEDAEAFGAGHLTPQGIGYTIEEVG